MLGITLICMFLESAHNFCSFVPILNKSESSSNKICFLPNTPLVLKPFLPNGGIGGKVKVRDIQMKNYQNLLASEKLYSWIMLTRIPFGYEFDIVLNSKMELFVHGH